MRTSPGVYLANGLSLVWTKQGRSPANDSGAHSSDEPLYPATEVNVPHSWTVTSFGFCTRVAPNSGIASAVREIDFQTVDCGIAASFLCPLDGEGCGFLPDWVNSDAEPRYCGNGRP